MDTAQTSNPTLGDSIDRLIERLQTARQNVTEIEAELAGARDKLRGVVKRTRKAKGAQPAKRGRPVGAKTAKKFYPERGEARADGDID